MHLNCLGTSHHFAPQSIREALFFDRDQQNALLARCGCERTASGGHLRELAVVSTCNRTELYAVTPWSDANLLPQLLAEASQQDFRHVSPYLYHMTDLEAARHLMRVSAGLDSMVTGEPQILGQVAEAYTLALGHGTAGRVLSRLFQAAIHAGKRARQETEISRYPSSISAVAVGLAARLVPALPSSSVLVIGAGEMAELVVQALHKRGVRRLTVLNRTLDRAQQIAARWGAEARPLEALGMELRETDVVLTSTGAPHMILRQETVAAAMGARPSRRLVILDIAIPRDVESAVAELDGVSLYSLDDLQGLVDEGLELRQGQIPQVERIVAQELETFQNWFQDLEIGPLVAELYQKAERIRSHQLGHTLRRMPTLDEQDRRRIDLFSRALVRRLLHDTTATLKREGLNGDAAVFVETARRLFALDGGARAEASTPPKRATSA
ncbi:MAG: Glutamyl-tRNA reductase [candidate division NC10 bacterium]|nr:Glutamyl-tRNA reductase [candidate division NC10 bacterium]